MLKIYVKNIPWDSWILGSISIESSSLTNEFWELSLSSNDAADLIHRAVDTPNLSVKAFLLAPNKSIKNRYEIRS